MLRSLNSPSTHVGSDSITERTYGVSKLEHQGGQRYWKPQQAVRTTFANRPGCWQPNKQDAAETGLENGSQASVQTNGIRATGDSSADVSELNSEGSKSRSSLSGRHPLKAEERGNGSRDGHSQEWKVAKVQQIYISSIEQPRKANISRSASLSEKELKEAKTRSQEIAAHLNNLPGANSRGVLLFNRRRQRVNNLTSRGDWVGTSGATTGAKEGKQLQASVPQQSKEVHVNHHTQQKAELVVPYSSNHSGVLALGNTMEEDETIIEEGTGNNLKGTQEEESHGDESLPQEIVSAPSEEPSAVEVEQAPLGDFVEESPTPTSTIAVDQPDIQEVTTAPAIQTELNATPKQQYCEVQLTLSKPAPVINRTARPFGNQSPAAVRVLQEKSPIASTNIDQSLATCIIVQERSPIASPIIDRPQPTVNIVQERSPIASPIISRPQPTVNIVQERSPIASPIIAQTQPTVNIVQERRPIASPIIARPQPTVNIEQERSPIASPIIARTQPTVNNVQQRSPIASPIIDQSRATVSIVQERSPIPSPNIDRSTATVSIVQERSPIASPIIDFPPPPTYAETLFTPPPEPNIRSPPSYSALYPNRAEHKPPTLLPQPSVTEVRRPPMPKSGVLEDAMARRGNKKSMFTFIEKPKLAPNPDLLSLVQNADERRKQREPGDTLPEEEHFALGAEASNFLNDNGLKGGNQMDSADIHPEWATCLKSPEVLHKPPLTPHKSLPEAGGKGAELFARRQSRMEKYVIESPSNAGMQRPPSPTMSLPPSWKYDISGNVSPTSRPFSHPVKSFQSSPKPASITQTINDNTESEQSQKELQISKHQPYQLQSSLFILSPVKDPMSSLPRSAPRPRPMLQETGRYARQTSCPTSPLPPSPHQQTPDPFRHIHPVLSQSSDNRIPVHNTRMSFGGPATVPEASPTSPVPFVHARVSSPRARATIQTPRPTFSAKAAGIESQERRASPLAATTWNPRVLQHSNSFDERRGMVQAPGLREANVEATRVISPPPPPPMSPSWSERSLSPIRQELEPKANRQMQALIARNIINAARRKSSSPRVPEVDGYRSSTPPVGTWVQQRSSSTSTTPTTPPWSPRSLGSRSPVIRSPVQSPVSGMTRSPLRLYTTRSPTDSDISVDSEDSGAKSPGLRSYNICPRGWNGSLRIKRGSLPVEASCTT